MICPRCEECKRRLREWINKQGHDKCHYYPEIFKAICSVLDVQYSVRGHLTITRTEFKQGCDRYTEEIYNGEIQLPIILILTIILLCVTQIISIVKIRNLSEQNARLEIENAGHRFQIRAIEIFKMEQDIQEKSR